MQKPPEEYYLDSLFSRILSCGGTEFYLLFDDGIRSFHNARAEGASLRDFRKFFRPDDYEDMVALEACLTQGLGERIMPEGFKEDKPYPLTLKGPLLTALARRFGLGTIDDLTDGGKCHELQINGKMVVGTLSVEKEKNLLLYHLYFINV